MSYGTAFAAYRTSSVQTATPERLLVMLYDGLVRFIQSSRSAIQAGNLQDAHISSKKAQDIVIELKASLKMEYEISHALVALYDWFLKRLIESNTQKTVEPLDDILPRIEELREAWVQAAMIVRTQGENSSAEPV